MKKLVFVLTLAFGFLMGSQTNVVAQHVLQALKDCKEECRSNPAADCERDCNVRKRSEKLQGDRLSSASGRAAAVQKCEDICKESTDSGCQKSCVDRELSRSE